MSADEKRQEPAMIAKGRGDVLKQTVELSTSVELVQEIIARASEQRASLSPMTAAPDGLGGFRSDTVQINPEASRDLSLAITHLEDARTRLNAAGYRLRGKFSISDAER